MKNKYRIFCIVLFFVALAGILLYAFVLAPNRLSTNYREANAETVINASENELPSRPYMLKKEIDLKSCTFQEYLTSGKTSVRTLFTNLQLENSILNANSITDIIHSRAEMESIKALYKEMDGLLASPEANLAYTLGIDLTKDRLLVVKDKINKLLTDKSRLINAYSGPIKGTWTTPDRIVLVWAPETDWLPDNGYDLFRTVRGETKKIAEGLGSQSSIDQLAKINKDFMESFYPLYDVARLDADDLKKLGFESKDAFNKAIYGSAKLNSEKIRITGDYDFELILNNKLSIPGDVTGKIPQTDAYGVTAFHLAREIPISPSNLGSIVKPVAAFDLEIPKLETNSAIAGAKDLLDARNTIMTQAFVDVNFAAQSGFGYEDKLEGAEGLSVNDPVSYMLVPKEGGISNTTAAEIASGLRPENAYSLSVKYGTETLVQAPSGFEGYGMDNVVSLRWDSSADPYERSIISGYHIERRRKGENEFKRITQSPVAISYSEDELGILYESPVFFNDMELINGDEATYRVQALDVFGRLSAYSDPLEIKVYKVTPPKPPIVSQPDLSAKLNTRKPQGAYLDIIKSNSEISGIILPITRASADTHHFILYRSKAFGTEFFGTPEILVSINIEPFTAKPVPMVAQNRTKGKFLINPKTEAKTDVLYYDNAIEPGYYYKYWVSAVDSWGNESVWSESKIIGNPLGTAPAAPAQAGVMLEPNKFLMDPSLMAPGFYNRLTSTNVSTYTDYKNLYGPLAFGDNQSNTEPEKAVSTEPQIGRSFSDATRLGAAVPDILSLALNNLPKVKDIHDLIVLENTDILPDSSAVVPWYHYAGAGISGYTVYRAYADGVSLEQVRPMSRQELIQSFSWKLAGENIETNRIVDTVEKKEGRLYLYLVCLVPEKKSEPVLEGFDAYVPAGWLRVDWQPVEDSQVSHYRVYRAEVPYFKEGQDLSALEWVMVGDNLKYTTYSEKVDQTYAHYYYFKVTSVSTWGVESDTGSMTKFRVPATSPPQAPAMLVPFSKKAVNEVNWIGVPHASKYVIYRHKLPRLKPEDMVSIQAAAPELFGSMFSQEAVSNIYFRDPSKLRIVGSTQKNNKIAFTLPQLSALTGRLNTFRLKDSAVIRKDIQNADLTQKLNVYSSIIDKYGVLAMSPYGVLDHAAALSIMWDNIGEIEIPQGEDSTGEKSFYDKTAVFGETYLYTVQAWNDDNLGSNRPEPVSCFTRKGQPFPALTGLRWESSENKPVIYWNAASDPNLGVIDSQQYIAGYLVYRSNTKDGDYYQASGLLPHDNNSFKDVNANLTSENWYKVRVVDTAGYISDFSEPVMAKTEPVNILPKARFKPIPFTFVTPRLNEPYIIDEPISVVVPPVVRPPVVSPPVVSPPVVSPPVVSPPVVKPPIVVDPGNIQVSLIKDTMMLNGFKLTNISIAGQKSGTGEALLNIAEQFQIPVTVTVNGFSEDIIVTGSAAIKEPAVLGNTGVYFKALNIQTQTRTAPAQSLVTGYILRDSGNVLGDRLTLDFENCEITAGGIIHILNNPVFHYQNLTFTGVTRISVNLNQFNFTGAPLPAPAATSPNVAGPMLYPGNCFINLHQGTAETSMGLETMDNKGFEFIFTFVGFDAQGRLSGEFQLNGSQYIRTVIPAGLGVRAKNGKLTYLEGNVDSARSSLSGYVFTPFQTFEDEMPADPNARNRIADISLNNINNILKAPSGSAALSSQDMAILNNGLYYMASLAQTNSLLIAPENPDILTIPVSSIPFSIPKWDGKGFVAEDTTMTPTLIGASPYFFSGDNTSAEEAIGATPGKVALDLSKTAFYSGETTEDTKIPEWMGIVVKYGNVSLPPDYIKSENNERVRFNITPGELLYDQNGFFYQNQSYTPEGVPVNFGEALGSFDDVIVYNIVMDIYNNKTNLQVEGDMAVPMFNSRLKVRLYTDEKIGKLVCSVAETDKMDPSGTGQVKMKVLNGYLDKQGLHLDGTLDFAFVKSLAFTDIQFNELVIPSDMALVKQENDVYGNALFDKPYLIKFHDFPLEIRALSMISQKSGEQISNATYTGPAFDTTMTLWGGMQLSDNLPVDANQDVDRIVIGKAYNKPAILYDNSKSKIEMDFEDFAQFEGVGTPKQTSSSDGIVEYDTDGLEMVFNGGLDAFTGMPVQVNTRIGYDRNMGRSFFAIAVFYGRTDSSQPKPPGIPIVVGELNDITGVIGYNLDMPKNDDGTYKFSKEKTSLFDSIDTMAVSKATDGNYFMALSAVLSMGYNDFCLGEVRNLYLVVEKGPTVEMGGFYFGPDSVDDLASTNGDGLEQMGEVHIGYYHQDRLFKFSLSLYGAGMYGVEVSGDVGFEMCPSYWELRLGYPEALRTSILGSDAWFGLTIRDSDIDESYIKAQAGFGYDTGDVTLGIVYIRAYLSVGGDGQYIFDDHSLVLHVYVNGGVQGGVKVKGKRFNVISLMLNAEGTLKKTDAWSLAAYAKIRYSVDLWLCEVSGSVGWNVSTSF